MSSDTVVPDHNGVWRPLDSAMQILTIRQMIIQELEEIIALLLLVPNNVPCELRVDVQRLLSSRRVRTDHGMDLLINVISLPRSQVNLR